MLRKNWVSNKSKILPSKNKNNLNWFVKNCSKLQELPISYEINYEKSDESIIVPENNQINMSVSIKS